jgi:sporulation-control protein spo0M
MENWHEVAGSGLGAHRLRRVRSDLVAGAMNQHLDKLEHCHARLKPAMLKVLSAMEALGFPMNNINRAKPMCAATESLL